MKYNWAADEEAISKIIELWNICLKKGPTKQLTWRVLEQEYCNSPCSQDDFFSILYFNSFYW